MIGTKTNDAAPRVSERASLEAVTRLDVAYDQALTASILFGRPEWNGCLLTAEEHTALHGALDVMHQLVERLADVADQGVDLSGATGGTL